ncbi:hypothetical protein BSSX_2162 [Bacillus subtilis]|nr:hypothetical protein BSSX_2162 [Bacillus subtilis]
MPFQLNTTFFFLHYYHGRILIRQLGAEMKEKRPSFAFHKPMSLYDI